MKTILLAFVLVWAATAQDRAPDTVLAPHVSNVASIPALEDLQKTVKAQAELIDWLQKKVTALNAQLQSSSAFFQTIMNNQALDSSKPPDPPKPAQPTAKK